jgi:organic hydroperoxide reductase OsmC/OhrA
MSMGNVHTYAARLVWEGNSGEGTASYEGCGRSYRVLIEGKPELIGTADPAFRGDASRHNPEDLFLAAISACHMLTYLALCARAHDLCFIASSCNFPIHHEPRIVVS